jgi:hypothetical protein
MVRLHGLECFGVGGNLDRLRAPRSFTVNLDRRTVCLGNLLFHKLRRDPVPLQLRRAGFHPSHRVEQIGLVFLGRGRATRCRDPHHVVRGLVGLGDVPPDTRHHLGPLGHGLLGEARGADGRGDTGEVGHLFAGVFQVDRLGVRCLLPVGRGVELFTVCENYALLGVHVIRGSVHLFIVG